MVVAVAALLAGALVIAITGGFAARPFGVKLIVRSAARAIFGAGLLLTGSISWFGWRATWNAALACARAAGEETRRHATRAIAGVFVLIVLSYHAFVPYWDAQSYFLCITSAVNAPFSVLNFRCVGHPSAAYLLLVGATQYVTPWNLTGIYAINAALGGASIVAFRRVVPRAGCSGAGSGAGPPWA